MNVNDFSIEIPAGEKLSIIFRHQYELMIKYHYVEQNNLGRKLPDPTAVDFDSVENQLRLKEFSWRITEELSEASEAIDDEAHYLEELIDAVHFAVELDLMCGITSTSLLNYKGVFYLQDLMDSCRYMTVKHRDGLVCQHVMWDAVSTLGVAMNCLKNKPWKSTHMLTDQAVFLKHMHEFNMRLIDLIVVSGLNALTLTQIYLNKNAVNQFRIRSNY